MRQVWLLSSATKLLMLFGSLHSSNAWVVVRPTSSKNGVVVHSRVSYALFSGSQPQDRVKDDEESLSSSRRAWLGHTITSAFGAQSLASMPLWVVPSVVLADDDSASTKTKVVVTSDLMDATTYLAALRSVQLAQRRLSSKAVREYIVTRDYPAVQALLRAAPVSDIRKACRKVVALLTMASGGPGATADSKPLLTTDAEAQLAATVTVLEREYSVFIQALERLDTTAMNGIRGRTVSDTEWQSVYANAVDALASFVTTAEQALL
jgi:hypothetical protein